MQTVPSELAQGLDSAESLQVRALLLE